MALTTTQANTILDNTFGGTVYLALFTANPTDAGGGTEVTGGGYARVVCAFDAAASRATANTALESFTASGANYGTVTGIAIMSASSGGNMLWWDALDTPRTVNDGDVLEFAAGSIDIAFSAS